MESFKYLFKIILIGDSNVGKSSIMLRFTTNRLKSIDYEPTIGVEFGSKIVQLNSQENIKLQLWDTAGQESFRSITRSYYRSSIGAILVFDLNCPTSFDNILHWLEETKRYGHDKMQVVLVANKADLQQTVDQTLIDQFLQENHFTYFKTSAINGTNIEQVFTTIARQIYQQILDGNIDPSKVIIIIDIYYLFYINHYHHLYYFF